MSTARRSVRRATVATAVLLAVFAAGMATDRWAATPGESHPDATGPAGGRSASVVDEAEQRIRTEAAHPVSQAELERAAVQGMLHALDDSWSAYYTPQDFTQFQDVLTGRYSGVGLWVHRDTAGRLVAVSVTPGSPADRAAVREGDQIVAVAGRPVAGQSVADVVDRLRGPVGSAVTLTVRRDGADRTVTVDRATVRTDDVSTDRIAPGVVRLRVAAFTRGVGRWVRERVADARAHAATGLVLDLRGDPGGLLDEAVETASAFLDGGPVVSYRHRGSALQVIDAVGVGDTALPLVVLVDGGTASAAEVVAGALQDRGRAVIVGSRTFGKGSVQQPSRLSDGSAVEMTVGHYLTPSGRSLDGVGIQPDVQVRPGAAPGVAEQRAVQVLSGMVADTGAVGRG